MSAAYRDRLANLQQSQLTRPQYRTPLRAISLSVSFCDGQEGDTAVGSLVARGLSARLLCRTTGGAASHSPASVLCGQIGLLFAQQQLHQLMDSGSECVPQLLPLVPSLRVHQRIPQARRLQMALVDSGLQSPEAKP